MQDQTFTIDSSSDGVPIALHFEVKGGKLVAMHGTDLTGRKYTMCVKLNLTPGINSGPDVVAFGEGFASDGSDAEPVENPSICCCYNEATGEMICQQVNGPCPQC